MAYVNDFIFELRLGIGDLWGALPGVPSPAPACGTPRRRQTGILEFQSAAVFLQPPGATPVKFIQ